MTTSGSLIRKSLRDVAAAVLGKAPDSCELLAGGANNVCARLALGGSVVLAKRYFWHSLDPRDRLGAEYGMLDLLWRNGVRNVPRPLAMDRESRTGFYEFIDGRCLRPSEVGWREVGQLSRLLDRMHEISRLREAHKLPDASDCVRASSDYLRNNERRFDRICQAARESSCLAFVEFVEKGVVPMHRRLGRYAGERARADGARGRARIRRSELTLSPADHGFHNVLRRPNGRLAFLDFEYAGWDDPAQMICNACLQPKIPIPANLRGRFLRDMVRRFGNEPSLAARVRLAYPLLIFKWALIMLNEFLPVPAMRRRFSGAHSPKREREQLKKAANQLVWLGKVLDAEDPLGIL